MKKPGKENDNLYRKRAEALLNEHKTLPSPNSSTPDLLRLIHELEVHQIELELVNEDLNNAQQANRIISQKYTELFDFAPIGVFVLSKDGQINDLNLNGAKMLGRNRSQLKNSRLGFFVSIDSKSIFNAFLEKIFQNEGYREACELKIKVAEDITYFVELTAVFLEKSNEYLITMMDIDFRKQAEFLVQSKSLEIEVRNEELTRLNLFLDIANKKSGESDRLKTAFLANMSHEIRTPMNGILGFADLLKDTCLSTADQQEYIRIIEKSGVRMLNIINEIIDISKIESSQMFLTISKTDINEQLKFIHTFFLPEAAGKFLHLEFQTGLHDDQAIINTDKEKLYAILLNLVKNAIKYTDQGTIEFGYVLKTLGKPGFTAKPDLLEFYVRDSGIGIHKERQQAIFERFIQADINDSRAFQGAGLGLTIAKSYVEMLGGHIWVVSDPDCLSGEKGSIFYFTIPYMCEVKENAKPLNEIFTKALEINAPQLKILVAEDDEFSKIFICNVLKNFATEFIYAANGYEAIEICKKNPDLDLILMDIKMPQLDGYQACCRIREFNKRVVIIAQTSFALKGDKEKAMAAGCNDYIAKPIKNAELRNMVRQHFLNHN